MAQRSLAVGWTADSAYREKYQLPLSTLLRHSLVCGTTGFGKSGLLLSLMLPLLQRHSGVGVVLIDCKGETAQELRDRFLPAMMAQGIGLNSEDVCCIEPFGPHGVRLNPMALPGLEPPVRVQIAVQVVESLIDGGLGPRMRSILTGTIDAVLAAGGAPSYLTVLRALTDSGVQQWLARKLPRGEARLFVEKRLGSESVASIQALSARLEWLLSLPMARGVLCSTGSITGRDLIESRLTIVDLGGVPMGFMALGQCLSSLIFNLLTAGVFNRPTQGYLRPTIVVCDEWQELVRLNFREVERLLSLARFKRVGLMLANQTLAQINEVSPALTRSLLTNVGFQVNFRPQTEDIRHLKALLPVNGNCIDPRYPDRLLSASDERKAVIEQLSRLPPRTALISDRIAGKAQIIRTLTLPYQQAADRSLSTSLQLRRSLRRGLFGVEHKDLLREAMSSDPLSSVVGEKHHAPEEAFPTGKKSRSSRRQPHKLVLP